MQTTQNIAGKNSFNTMTSKKLIEPFTGTLKGTYAAIKTPYILNP